MEEDGKSIQLSSKAAKVLQTCSSPFPSISPHFPSGMLLNPPPPRPLRPKKSGFWVSQSPPLRQRTVIIRVLLPACLCQGVCTMAP